MLKIERSVSQANDTKKLKTQGAECQDLEEVDRLLCPTTAEPYPLDKYKK